MKDTMIDAFRDAVLTIFDRDEASALLTQAFFDNPAHVFLYPNAVTRRARLMWLMKANLGVQFALGRSFAVRDRSERVAAMGFWHPPGSPEASPALLARHGLLALPFRHGLETFRCTLKVINMIEARRKACLNGQPSWYLNNMVVRFDYQGRGLGSSILRRELSYVVDTSPFPASLVTQRPQNVTFYEKLGFQVTNAEPIAINGRSFPNWIMVRQKPR